ncbi:MAG: amidohydrolase family protein [Balneolia bacterium]|nr:amidohydrolase family protein [Balneolia bacterium]
MRYPLIFTVLALSALLLVSCGNETPSVDRTVTAYTGATMINGLDQPAIENSVLVVENGMITEAGARGQVDIPQIADIVDITGKYIMPGLINAHGHVGMADGLETGSDVFTRDNVRSQLLTYAQYGVTTVVSLGDGRVEGARFRDEMLFDQHINLARYYLAGPVISVDTPEEGREEVRRLHEAGMDWIKIRIDSGLGTREKMQPDVYQAIADEANRLGLPSAAHIVELEDAIGAIEAGYSLIAHSIRDTEVNDELISLMVENGIPITPTLTREVSTYIYRERPDFFDDPFFLRTADPEVIAQLESPERQQQFADSEAGAYFEQQLPLAMENMMKLYEAGVIVAMGTDSGPPARFQGYFEHMEMEMMQDAGMSPHAIIMSATSLAATAVGLDNLTGSLQEGLAADFIILGDNPMDDIQNLRSLEAVYVMGNEVPMPLQDEAN